LKEIKFKMFFNRVSDVNAVTVKAQLLLLGDSNKENHSHASK